MQRDLSPDQEWADNPAKAADSPGRNSSLVDPAWQRDLSPLKRDLSLLHRSLILSPSMSIEDVSTIDGAVILDKKYSTLKYSFEIVSLILQISPQ